MVAFMGTLTGDIPADAVNFPVELVQ